MLHSQWRGQPPSSDRPHDAVETRDIRNPGRRNVCLFAYVFDAPGSRLSNLRESSEPSRRSLANTPLFVGRPFLDHCR